MIYAVALILVVFNWLGVGAGFSFFGQRLELDPRPLMLRLRWLSMGMIAALAISGYPFQHDGWVGWTSVLLLAISSTRRLAPPAPSRLPPLDSAIFPPVV
ncbi:MAG: hypothetical protein V4719_29765 [Planctomycetota bacterium]